MHVIGKLVAVQNDAACRTGTRVTLGLLPASTAALQHIFLMLLLLMLLLCLPVAGSG
jgi:hypothetical protein